MGVELCARNFVTSDGLVNGVDGIFQRSTKILNSQEVIWILFNNPKCDQFTRIKNAHLYEHETHLTWTLIKPICKYIQIGSIFLNIIIRTQFLIQLVITHTIHQTQGLTFDFLTFDPTDVYKHGLTYTTFSHLKKKLFFYLFQPLQMIFFQIDPSVAMEMR
jgi:hypothetical protein